ncbi:tRNA lysidine(34) synthetase TilS [Spirosoma sp. HMF3257]|uniref:tRNA(Ile)-lysidine synthase n=2 Tax=Spirosoma telluris TaxID=2183553 RepID=A0A327NFS5_9BACT|nr:tRNA lysidine(34) synthetase TilS [Spirosoma telluris]RAI73653.1 tRNA lysidine(34) synthetase TilS [Spirosoma telluris]
MVEQTFLAFINDNQLFGSSDRVLLAVSGGIDSMVMAELFYRTAKPFAIAHVNFGLRGADSEADALFVQNKAAYYGVPFHLTRFDTAAIATERGISIQMVARELRYTWFAQLLQDFRYACVATAHHQNDVLETLLLNLTRGTGLAGLHGIMSSQNGVVRPLLFTSRAQLAAFAEEQNVLYREDSSNSDDKYARNRIRHHVVPILTELNPGLWHTLPRTVERLRAAETLMQAELQRSWQEVSSQQGDQTLLPTDKLRELSELTFRLSEWLKPFGFTDDQVKHMVDSLHQPVGQVFESPTHRICHERMGLVLEPLPTPLNFEITLTEWPNGLVEIAGGFALTVEELEKIEDFRPPTDPNIACLDADKLIYPLTIRPWRQGDRFRPLGLNGHKLVSDLLNDLKLGRTEREQTAVLLSGDQIAWVIGRRIDHRFRIQTETKRIVRFILDRKTNFYR